MTTTHASRTFVPAAGHDFFLPFYDLLTRVVGVDRARTLLLEQAGLRPGHRVLDIGCGTGTLSILVRRLHPQVEVVGLDPDPKALARARRKAERAAVPVRFDAGFADALAYGDGTFDRVFSSMMFHHLEPDQKEKTLREARRVLKPGGRLQMLDFAGPGADDGAFSRLLHSHHRLRENAEERIVALMGEAGFEEARSLGHPSLLLGRVVYYQAVAPASR